FAAYLIRNKAVGVHIIGHTDDRGELIDNQLLSERRAAAVAHALTTAGVRLERITSVGFGETAPITTNTTEAGRARNRRTEFEILLKN
ncbi:MAG: OmpA family protein, partial [Flavobacteriales bacterium]|nr:OmpA family protein [Flavobacteriales bacterium]